MQLMCTVQTVTTVKEQKQEYAGADNQVFVRRDPAVTYLHRDMSIGLSYYRGHRDVAHGRPESPLG